MMGGRAVGGERVVRAREDVGDPARHLGVWQDEFRFEAPPEVAGRFRSGDAFERAVIKAAMLEGAKEALQDLTQTDGAIEWTAAGGRVHVESAKGFAAAATIDERGSDLAVRGVLVGVERSNGRPVELSLSVLSDPTALARAEQRGREVLARELGIAAEPEAAREAAAAPAAEAEPVVLEPPFARRTIERDDVRGRVPDPLERYRRALGDERADAQGDAVAYFRSDWVGKSPVQLERRLAEIADDGDPFERFDGRSFLKAQRLERDLRNISTRDPDEAEWFKRDSLQDEIASLRVHPDEWLENEGMRAGEVLFLRYELAVVREHQLATAVHESIVLPPTHTPTHLVNALGSTPARGSEDRAEWEELVDLIERDRFAQDTDGFTAEVETPSPPEMRERERHSDAVVDRVREWRRDRGIDTPVESWAWSRGPELQQEAGAREVGVEM